MRLLCCCQQALPLMQQAGNLIKGAVVTYRDDKFVKVHFVERFQCISDILEQVFTLDQL